MSSFSLLGDLEPDMDCDQDLEVDLFRRRFGDLDLDLDLEPTRLLPHRLRSLDPERDLDLVRDLRSRDLERDLDRPLDRLFIEFTDLNSRTRFYLLLSRNLRVFASLCSHII